MLALVFQDVSLDLDWLLLGTRFAIDDNVRWILTMSVADLVDGCYGHQLRLEPRISAPFFLLTMAGNLGAVLAADLVGFFCFSTIMGYGFYGLLIQGGNDAVRRAARLYIIFLVEPTWRLFEALLLAASTTENLRFEAVRQAMAASQFYFWVGFAGFVLKSGIWPAQLWLSAVFKSAPLSKTVLLGGVPIAMGLLGIVRCLPLGEQVFDVSGTVILVLGVVAMLYAVLRFFTLASVKLLPAWACVAVTGLFTAALGMGLAYPDLWRQYQSLAYPFIASLGIFLVLLSFVAGRLQDTRQQPGFVLPRVKALGLRAGRWIAVIQRRAKDGFLGLQSLWHASWLQVVKRYQRIILDWQKSGFLVGGWSARIIMFVLLGLALAWLAR